MSHWAVPILGLILAVLAVVTWTTLRRSPTPEATLPRAGTVPAAASSTVLDPTLPPAAPAGPGGRTPSNGVGTTGAGTSVTVHVAGAVTRPGVVTLPAGSRAVDAVAAAGGLVAGADPDRVNLAAKLVDGVRLVVPLVGQPPVAELSPLAGGAVTAGPGGGAGTGAPVDLNSATAEQLDALPGVGPATAAAIISYRQRSGPFKNIDELLEVRGIGQAKLDALRDLVVVAP